MRLLIQAPLSKAELSTSLGHKEISGQLNKIIRELLQNETVEYTIPDKPQSRLQKYRITDKGRRLVAGIRRDNK
jgi:ATP-dependent DNA helicase RecG